MYVDIKWVKLSVNWYKSDDIQLIRKLPDGDTIALVFVMMLAMAGERNEGGYIPYSEEDLSALLDVPIQTIRMAIRAMESRRMIDFDDGLFHITNWDKYQSVDGMEKIKEQNRERVARFRERQKQKALETPKTAPALPEPEKEEKSPMDRRFERFWKAYPKKVGKGAAERSFKKYKPNDDLTDRMIASVEAHKRSDQWKKDGGQYIPNPATWLNQRRWEDELDEEPLPFSDPPEPGYIRDESIEDWN